MLVPIDIENVNAMIAGNQEDIMQTPTYGQANYMDIDTNNHFSRSKAYTGWNKLSATPSLSVTDARSA